MWKFYCVRYRTAQLYVLSLNPETTSFIQDKVCRVTNSTNDAILSHLNSLGISDVGSVFVNLNASQLYEQSVTRSECQLTDMGALCVETGTHTGRSAQNTIWS